MAVLSVVDERREIRDVEFVQQYLARIGIEYERWELNSKINENSTEEAILAAYSDEVERLKQDGRFTKVDVVNVNPITPNLDAMLAKFSEEHWHDEDEVRFTVYGRGLYHVHPADSSVVALEVDAGDMIRVPRGTLHWFNLCAEREIKAIRFFQDPNGWTPHYTETALEKQYEPVCFGLTYLPTEKTRLSPWPPIH